MDGASAGNGLKGNGALLLDCCAVGPEDELLCGSGEFAETGNGQVFVV